MKKSVKILVLAICTSALLVPAFATNGDENLDINEDAITESQETYTAATDMYTIDYWSPENVAKLQQAKELQQQKEQDTIIALYTDPNFVTTPKTPEQEIIEDLDVYDEYFINNQDVVITKNNDTTSEETHLISLILSIVLLLILGVLSFIFTNYRHKQKKKRR